MRVTIICLMTIKHFKIFVNNRFCCISRSSCAKHDKIRDFFLYPQYFYIMWQIIKLSIFNVFTKCPKNLCTKSYCILPSGAKNCAKSDIIFLCNSSIKILPGIYKEFNLQSISMPICEIGEPKVLLKNLEKIWKIVNFFTGHPVSKYIIYIICLCLCKGKPFNN